MISLSEYEDPPGAYAFHRTPRENVESIREVGIKPDIELGSDTHTIQDVLGELGYTDPFPFDRANTIYCYVDCASVEDTYNTVQESGLGGDDVVIVIAVEEIEAPMYLADMGLMSDLIDYRHAGPEKMISADSPEEIVRLYQESIVKISDPDDIVSELESDRRHLELAIDGEIPPSAIMDIRPHD